MSIPTLIKTVTASSDATISFVHGTSSVVFDGTYDEYWFVLSNIHPESTGYYLLFNGTTDGSNYNVTKTSTVFYANNPESGTNGSLVDWSRDQGGHDQDTAFHNLTRELKNDADSSSSGILQVFSPSNTSLVKHWMSTVSCVNESDHSQCMYTSGYFNTTSAITGIQFKVGSGDIDAGTIQLFGIA